MSDAPPTAADLVTDPAKVQDADPAALPVILTQLSAAALAIAARLTTLPSQAPASEGDHLIRADEAARLLCMSSDWCLRSPAAKSFRVMIGSDVRFSFAAIQKHIARHRGR